MVGDRGLPDRRQLAESRPGPGDPVRDLQVWLPVCGEHCTKVRRRSRPFQSLSVRAGDEEVGAHRKKFGLRAIDGKSERGCNFNDGGEGVLREGCGA
eukprot:10433019-Alexandrium_andersonii.AAC.1